MLLLQPNSVLGEQNVCYTNKTVLNKNFFVVLTKQFFLCTNGPSTYNAHIVPKIENFRFCVSKLENKNYLDYGQEEVEQIHNSLMGSIIGDVKVTNCGRLEDMEEGAELLITAIRPICYRSKTKYILEFENIPNKYVSNYWLEQELEEVDQNYKIKIKCDKLKTTPSKHMERMVFCA